MGFWAKESDWPSPQRTNRSQSAMSDTKCLYVKSRKSSPMSVRAVSCNRGTLSYTGAASAVGRLASRGFRQSVGPIRSQAEIRNPGLEVCVCDPPHFCQPATQFGVIMKVSGAAAIPREVPGLRQQRDRSSTACSSGQMAYRRQALAIFGYRLQDAE